MPESAPNRLARVAAYGGAAGVGAVGGLIGVAYIQARLAIGNQPYTVTAIDGLVGHGEGRDTVRVVWLGDSLAAGLGAITPDFSIPRLVAQTHGRHTRLHSFAVPGATSDDVVRYQLPALDQLRHGLAEIGQRIDAIGVTVGGNDVPAFTPRRRFRKNIRRIIEAAGGRPLVLVSIPNMNHALRLRRPLRTLAAARATWLDQVLRGEAARHGNVHYASVRRRPAWIRRQDLRNFLAADRFHPSGAGYAVWADQITVAFEVALAGEAAAATPP